MAQEMKGLTCLRDLPACCRAVIPDKHLKIRVVHFSLLYTLNLAKKKKKKKIEQFCQCNTKMQRLAP